MVNLASARINTFGLSPKADFVPPDDPILEIPASELQALCNSSTALFNDILDIAREERLLDKKDSAEMLINAQNTIKNEKSPIQKLILLNVFIQRAFKPIREAISRRPAANAAEKIIQATTKVKIRAMMLFEHVKTIAKGERRKKDFAFSSPDVRTFLAGKEGQAPSRRDAIRAMEKAECLFPALRCEHTPNDGRQTIRIIAKIEDLDYCDFIEKDGERSKWQRFRMGEVLPFMNANPNSV
jgi:hypothetical protein